MVLRLLTELEVDRGPGRPGSTPGSCGPVATCGNEVFADDLRLEPRPKPLSRLFRELIEIVASLWM
jgi:hypothetical protein